MKPPSIYEVPLSKQEQDRVKVNAPLAYHYAEKMFWASEAVRRLGRPDVHQASVLGLAEAVRRFNGNEATWHSCVFCWVRNAIQQAVRRDRAVRVCERAVSKGEAPDVVTTSWGRDDPNTTISSLLCDDPCQDDLIDFDELVRPAMLRLKADDPKAYRAVLRYAFGYGGVKSVKALDAKHRSTPQYLLDRGLMQLRYMLGVEGDFSVNGRKCRGRAWGAKSCKS